MSELSDKFHKCISNFLKENKLKIENSEFKKLVREFDFFIHSLDNNEVSINPNSDNEDIKDFAKLQEQILQQCIDFINSHPKVKESLELKQKELTEKINIGYDKEFELIPDTRIYFLATGLDESIEHKEWVPTTDSSFSLSIGDCSVLFYS